MKILLRVLISVFSILGILALLGVHAAYTIKPTHNPSIHIGEFIRKTGGRWPGSWAEFEEEGFKRPFNKKVEVAWHVDPYELLRNGKVAGEVPNGGNSCMVVYLPNQKPEGKVDWLLHPWMADALRELPATGSDVEVDQ